MIPVRVLDTLFVLCLCLAAVWTASISLVGPAVFLGVAISVAALT